MVHLKDINLDYTLLNYGGKTLRDTLTTLSTNDLIIKKNVLKNLSLHVSSGTIYGLLGKNGSGKSTLLRTIAGVLPIRSGEKTIEGKVSPLIGVNSFTDGDLTTEENIKFYCVLRGFSKERSNEFRTQVLDFCHYTESELLKPVKTFSHGMIARLNFALGIFEDCNIYLIDEVLSVVDRSHVSRAVEEIKHRKNKGAIVFFVSHNLKLVEWVSDIIGIIDQGKVSNEGDSHKMAQLYKGSYSK